ncbi:Rrf2 family transcriptional regulator [Bacillus sp. JCM 19041]|uniref:Rrf2 family transcriptional regulator n=1 Tax=Bacillus sp. JCM 19041 TaxID=1460637 RepID=UPI000B101314
MQFTSFTDYALRTLIYAGTIEKGNLATLGRISGAYGISDNHLKQIVQALSKTGYIETVSGRNGGIRLALEPECITIGSSVREFKKMDLIEF